MKRVFQVEVEVNVNSAHRLPLPSELRKYLSSDTHFGNEVEFKIIVVDNDKNGGGIMNEKEKEVYEKLLVKIENETDADTCAAWTAALEHLANAIEMRIMAGLKG